MGERVVAVEITEIDRLAAKGSIEGRLLQITKDDIGFTKLELILVTAIFRLGIFRLEINSCPIAEGRCECQSRIINGENTGLTIRAVREEWEACQKRELPRNFCCLPFQAALEPCT